MIKIKYDFKVISAFQCGLQDGVLKKVLDVPLKSHLFYTKKEKTAYIQASKISQSSTDFVEIWKLERYNTDMLEYCLKHDYIEPIGWKISRCIDSNFKPFIEKWEG